MTTYLTLRFVFGLAFVLAQPVASCGGGPSKASCLEACETSADCGYDLSCFNTTAGKVCEPEGCRACFESGRTCYRDENTQEQESEGAMRECSFRECG